MLPVIWIRFRNNKENRDVDAFLLDYNQQQYLVEKRIKEKYQQFDSKVNFSEPEMDYYDTSSHNSLFDTIGEYLRCDFSR